MEHKSEQLMQTALSNGWKAQVVPDIPESGNADEIVWNLYCLRGKETMHVQYVGNRQTDATYTYGAFRSNPPRRVNIVKLLTGSPNTKRLGVLTEEEADELKTVPFLPDSPDMDILLKCRQKKLVWVNGFTGLTQEAVVNVDLSNPTSAKNYRVYESKAGRRLLEWVDAFGFHAVALEQIINVV